MNLYSMKYVRKDINKFAIFPAVPIVLNGQKLSSFRHLCFYLRLWKIKVISMFEMQVGAKTKIKYELQGLFTTERIYMSLNRKNVLSLDTNVL